MEKELGCKAFGLQTGILFSHGLPHPDTFDCVASNLDEQLADTNKQIEECIRSIMEMSRESHNGSFEEFLDPGDALNSINERQVFERASCIDPDADSITSLLHTILQRLEDEPGCEEVTLQQLLELSSREGVILPVRSSASDPIGVSYASLNQAISSSETDNEQLWNEISLKLRKYYVEKLKQLPIIPDRNVDHASEQRLAYIQSLCTLYSPSDVWQKYLSIRSAQYDTLTLNFNPSSRSPDTVSLSKGVAHFEGLVTRAKAMMMEDFCLVNSGVFGHVITTMNAIKEIYLDMTLDEINAIVESLESELSSVKQNKSSKSKASSDVTKSTSESMKLSSSRRGNLRKQNSKSMDSLLSPNSDEQFTDLHSLPTNAIGLQVRFVSCIVAMDSFLTGLQHAMTWQVTAAMRKPTRIRSALKSRKDDLLRKALASRSAVMDSDDDMTQSSLTKHMMSELTSSMRVIEKESVDKELWDWTHAFKKVASDIAKCVAQYIASEYEKANVVDSKCLDQTKCFEMMGIDEQMVGGKLDYPRQISTGMFEFFRAVDMLLPMIHGFHNTPVFTIKNAFVDSLTQCLKTLAVKLNKLNKEVTTLYPLKLWYQCLSNEAFIRNQLYYYDTILISRGENSKKPFNAVYRQYVDIAETTAEMIRAYHVTSLWSCVLHDADSNDWSNDKDFYEDERCSFVVQMFNLHMKSLRHDLWSCCPAKQARNIYVHVLKEGVAYLAQRYAHVTPSYRRTKQVKFDVTTLLMCVSELLLPCCGHVGHYLDASSHDEDIWSIHNSCCTLVAAMAVICAPVDVLYKVFKKGFGRKSRRGRYDDIEAGMHISQWLTCVLPDLYPFGVQKYEDLQTTTAIHLQLRLLSAQPEIDYPLLLQSLIMKEYALAILLLTQVTERHDVDTGASDATDDKAMPVRGNDGTAVSAPKENARVLEICSCFLTLLTSLDRYPDALSLVWLPIFERQNCWELLNKEIVLGIDIEIPPWIECILDMMQPFLHRVIEAGLRVLLRRAESKPRVPHLASELDTLPCGCSPTHSHQHVISHRDTRLRLESTDRSTDGRDESHAFSLSGDSLPETKEVLAEALYSMLVQLNSDVTTLSASLILLFRALADRLRDKHVTAPHNCPAIKLIATGLRRSLLDMDFVTSQLGVPLMEDSEKTVNLLADCIYHVLTAESYGKGSGIPRVASLFMKANRNWLNEQIEIMLDHFFNDGFDQPRSPPLVGQTPEFTLDMLTVVTSNVMNAPRGASALLNLYRLVSNNLPWIHAQLDIPPLLGKKTSPTAETFTLSLAARRDVTFNPLEEFAKIGSVKFDMTEIHDVDFDWSSLLQSDLGLSEVGFKSLLFNRYEMQPNAPITDDERRPVDALKKRFETETTDVV